MEALLLLGGNMGKAPCAQGSVLRTSQRRIGSIVLLLASVLVGCSSGPKGIKGSAANNEKRWVEVKGHFIQVPSNATITDEVREAIVEWDDIVGYVSEGSMKLSATEYLRTYHYDVVSDTVFDGWVHIVALKNDSCRSLMYFESSELPNDDLFENSYFFYRIEFPCLMSSTSEAQVMEVFDSMFDQRNRTKK